MHCPRCGKETEGPLFCEYCGASLETSPPPAAQPKAVPKPQPQSGPKRRPSIPRQVWVLASLGVAGLFVVSLAVVVIFTVVRGIANSRTAASPTNATRSPAQPTSQASVPRESNTPEAPAANGQQVVYSNDFEGGIGPEFGGLTIDTTPSGRNFLGQFGNRTVSLSLGGLPAHTEVRVDFDLYIIRSWDGNWPDSPDVWTLMVNGAKIIETTFDNQADRSDHSQAYPGNYPGSSNPPLSGVEQRNSLGYEYGNNQMDAVYHLSYSIPHTDNFLEIDFVASGLTSDIADESWGLDNVIVTISD